MRLRRFQVWLLVSVLCPLARAYTGSYPTITSTGVNTVADPDVQNAITASLAGGNAGTVILPSGTFTWTSAVTISGGAVKVEGAGAGRVVGRSASSVSVGNGSKSFVLADEYAQSIIDLRAALTASAAVRIQRTGSVRSGGGGNTDNVAWMEGTVTSFTEGTDTLVVNVTDHEAATSGNSYEVWIISTIPASRTRIVNDLGDNTYLLDITESTAGSVEVSGIHFSHSAVVGGETNRHFFRWNAVTNGLPIKAHDLYFAVTKAGTCFYIHTNRGLVWDTSFVSVQYSNAAAQSVCTMSLGTTSGTPAEDSWNAVSTMGTADTTGRSNVYFEDCDAHAFGTGTDINNGGRIVMRYMLWNNSGFGSHGAESSWWGMRHFEIYGSEFFRNDFSSSSPTQTLNVTQFFLIRGGTGVITGNKIHDFGGNEYPVASEILLAVWQLQYNGGVNPLWGADIAGIQYRAPRQTGTGYINGTGLDGKGNNTDGAGFVGDSEPLYIWNNTGGGDDIGLSAYSSQLAGQDNIDDYLQLNRDYFTSTKSGWTAYAYPHPQRTDQSAATYAPRAKGQKHPAFFGR